MQMNMIKVSNIMGIDPKPFDPKTYVEEDTFVTDESGSKKRIRLENNIVRWRRVRNPDGTTSVSNDSVIHASWCFFLCQIRKTLCAFACMNLNISIYPICCWVFEILSFHFESQYKFNFTIIPILYCTVYKFVFIHRALSSV